MILVLNIKLWLREFITSCDFCLKSILISFFNKNIVFLQVQMSVKICKFIFNADIVVKALKNI